MRREEKRRKFHESLHSTLYPPPAPSPSPLPEPQLEKDVEIVAANFDVNLIPDDYGLQDSSPAASDNDDGESESAPQKLTRAQRKRLRKKKLKDDRKQLVGPLLPSPSLDSYGGCIEGGGGSTGEKCTQPVRQNAEDSCGPSGGQSKQKLRRMAKKLAKERLKHSSDCKGSDQDQSFELIDGENCDQDRKL